MRCPSCGFDTTDLRSVLPVVFTLLQREGRVTYRSLKREFGWDDAFLEDVREELAFKRMATEEDGRGLVWTGASPVPSFEFRVPSPTQPPTPNTQSPAERRQLTVMFCDLVGSTALSTQLDPEDLREVVRNYQETAAAVLTQYEGHIAQYLGDGILTYFGYPRAHEDDAQRAVRAGLEIIEALREQGSGNGAPGKRRTVQVRIGIHTGLVVVGEMGSGNRREHLALGETPNVAARIQGLAEPNTVVISAATARLLQGTFVLEDLGLPSVKGLEEPLSVSRVLSLQEGQHGETETADNGASALVGREEEVGLLHRRWQQSKEGLGQVVLISGEAGIGKSALVEKIRADVRREGATRILFRCSPYHQSSTLYPVIAHLQRLLDWQRNESAIDKLDKLERLLGTYQFPQKETAPLFATLLSLPPPEGRYAPLQLNPQQQKQQALDALAAWLVEETERTPVLLTWEDLQWADPSSLELLRLVIDQAPTAAMLNVLTYRPDFLPPWPTRSHITPLTLNRLERPQAEVMITRRAGGKTLPPEVIQHIVQKTDGVPLFVEELTKMVLESGILKETDDQYQLNGPLSAVAIPATLQGSLMARLDRLPHVREIAQLGAVLGREFAYEMLKSLTTIGEEQLQQQLVQLVEAELFYQRGRPPHAKYVFKHALLQDAAYASLLRSTRQHYHQQIAQLFENQFPEMVETQPELVAYHYTKAERPEQAIIYWQKAGARAVQLSANLEAINHLTTGLELLSALPDTPERAQRALDFHTAVGPAFMATKGLAAPEVEQTYNQVRALSLQLGETARLAPALLGLSTFYLTRGEFQTARELGEQLLSLGQQQQDSALCVEAYSVLGTTVFHLGEFAHARAYLEQGIALYDSHQHRFLAFRYGQDPGVFCLCYLVRMLWFLGYPDQARQRSQEAMALAQELSHPFSLALAYTFAALVHQLRREERETQEWAEKAIAVCIEHGFGFYSAMGAILRGGALVAQGEQTEGLEQILHGLDDWRATGSELFRPHLLALLAETHGLRGKAEEGLAVLAEALDATQKSGTRFYTAELYRLKGELTLQQERQRVTGNGQQGTATDSRSPFPDPQGGAEVCFSKAIEIARQQEAKSWELRAATSLARLWQNQGKRDEAHSLLSQIYNWFTEGFDTKDLQDAKTLIEELGH